MIDAAEKSLDKAFELFSLPIMNRCYCDICNNFNWEKDFINKSIKRGMIYFISPSYIIGYSDIYIRAIVSLDDEVIKLQYMNSCPNDSGAVLSYEFSDVMERLNEEEMECVVFNLDLFK